MPARPPFYAGLWGLAALAAGLAGALLAGPLAGAGPLMHQSAHLPWLLFAVLFGLTEIFLVHFEHRRESHGVSLSAIPLVIGLYVLSPVALVVARILGSATSLVLHRRQPPVKLAVNLAAAAVEVTVAAGVFLALADGYGIGSWPAAFAAAVVADFVQSLVITAAIALVQRRFEFLWEAAALGPITSALNTCVALVAVTVLSVERGALVPLGLVVVLLSLSYQRNRRLSEKHRHLEELYDFTRSMGEAVLDDDLLPVLLDRMQELLHADAAWLYVAGEDGSLLRVSRGGDGSVESEPCLPGDEAVSAAGRAAGEAVLLAGVEGLPFDEFVVAPLARLSGPAVTAVVADRSGAVRRFGPDDVRLFATLANHACAALENAHLLEALRVQAAASRHQSLHDALTGLPNRLLFAERLDASLAGSEPVAVLLLDLDRFKEVNDTLGHHIGDLLLQEVGRRLTATVRRDDTVARLGGDEFAVLLPGADGEAAGVAVARSLLASLEEPFQLAGVTVNVGASLGVALAPAHGSDGTTLLQRADVAMYAAKADQAGVVIYRSDIDHYSPDRLALAAALRTAIERGELDVHYQPQIDLATGAVTGAEALVRWPSAPLRISPAEVVAVAEQTGLIRPLTQLVLERATGACARWSDGGRRRLRVSVNVSARSLIDPTLVGDVTSALARAGLPASALCLEITETSLMADRERTAAVLAQLTTLGVSIAIDDFGTGYSSLGYLKRLPVSEIKIDKSFVLGMDDDSHDEAIVASVVGLASNLSLPVVAEGVETHAACQRLRQLGCAMGQGYLFSRPVPEAEFAVWLSDKAPAAPVIALAG